jgi:hypothetical protein
MGCLAKVKDQKLPEITVAFKNSLAANGEIRKLYLKPRRCSGTNGTGFKIVGP